MKTTRKLMFGIGCLAVLVVARAASADWLPSDPYKWLQPPDCTANSMAVATHGNSLADDFECRMTEHITAIHLWAAYAYDWEETVLFDLAIYSDVPAGPGVPFSHPGQQLWSRSSYPTSRQLWATIPSYGSVLQPSTGVWYQQVYRKVWEFNFEIPEAEAFLQQGSPSSPVTYWLVMRASSFDESLCWVASTSHWNDDAASKYDYGSWGELRYPSGHPYAGQSVDFAFVIVPEPATVVLLMLGVVGVLTISRRAALPESQQRLAAAANLRVDALSALSMAA